VLRRRRERRRDQRPGLRGIDHVVELEQRRRVQRPGVLLGQRGEVADAPLALALVGDRLELLAQAELDRALEAHRPEVRRRPGDREQRLVQAAGDHRLCAQSVGAPQDHRDEGHAQRAAGHQQARGVRTRPVASAFGPTIIPGVSTSETIGRPNASHSCMKRDALSARRW
jgi:hypothetical protein